MIVKQNEVRLMFQELKKRFGGNATIDEVIKRTINNDINFKHENDTVDLLQANLLSSFWIRNVIVELNPKLILGNFDAEAIVGIYRVNNAVFELIDIENHKLRVKKEDISVKVCKVPLDVFLSFII